jgi:hypothetical protein
MVEHAGLLLEERQAADVHGRGGTLKVEKRRVECREAIGHDDIVPRPRA